MSGNTLVIGGISNNEYKGTNERDFIYGQGGADKLSGGNGVDYLAGGIGSDELYGGLNADTLEGGRGADKLYGDEGSDWLSGFRDSERKEVYLDDGSPDQLFGGSGNDVLLGYGTDILNGEAGYDSIGIENPNGAFMSGGGGNDLFNVVTSGGYSNVSLTISDSDSGDVLTVNNSDLYGGSGYWQPGTPDVVFAEDESGNTYTRNFDTGTLVVHLSG